MKKLLLLFLSIFAINIATQAAEITFFSLDITADGEKFSKTFAQSDEPVIDLSNDPVQSIVINSVLAFADGMNNVQIHAAVYPQGTASDQIEWHTVPLSLTNNDDNTWTASINQELVNHDTTAPCVFEFYLSGVYTVIDGDVREDRLIRYDNGGQNYKVIFVYGGDQDWKVKFYSENTGSMTFVGTDGQTYTFSFSGNASRTPSAQSDAMRGFYLDEFALSFIYNKEASVNVQSVSLQYCLHEEGVEASGWATVAATSLSEESVYNPDKQVWEYRITARATKLDKHFDEVAPGVIIGFDPTKKYVLDIYFQVVADGKYFMLGKKNPSISFTWMDKWEEPQPQETAITYGDIILSYNGGEKEVGFGYDTQGNCEFVTRNQTAPATITSIDISQADIYLNLKEGAKVNGASLQFQVYPEGSQSSDSWNTASLWQFDSDTWYTRRGASSYVPLTTGFPPGNYILEICFQLIADGNYYFLAKGQTNARIPFTISGTADGISSPDAQAVIQQLCKRLEQGKVVIYCNGKKYSAAGALIP